MIRDIEIIEPCELHDLEKVRRAMAREAHEDVKRRHETREYDRRLAAEYRDGRTLRRYGFQRAVLGE